jgi:long-chain fatty acid transport protein
MAHTGAGITTLGSEAMHFNPGGLGFLDKTLDLSAGVTFIIPEVEFWGVKDKPATTTKMGTPLYVYAASSFLNGGVSAGVSFTTPYGNSADYGKNWEGADLVQEISLAVYAVQPTVAVNLRGFGLPALSFGAGPTINFGSFSQSKRMAPVGTLNAYAPLVAAFDAMGSQMPALAPYGKTFSEIVNKNAEEPISATFEGDADVAVGFHLGTMYEILPNKLSLGVSYRSKVDMKVSKGKVKEDITKLNEALVGAKEILTAIGQGAAVPDPNPAFSTITSLGADNFEATLPLPSNLNAGVSFRPIESLLLAFDFQWIGWGAYDELVMEFDNTYVGIVNGAPTKKQVSDKNYHDTFAYRFGIQYTAIDQLDVRCGVYVDETPVDRDYLTPESPSTKKLGSTIGLSFRPIPNLSIDAAFLYSVSVFGRDAWSGSNPDKADGLDGRYEVQAWVPSIGLGFNF